MIDEAIEKNKKCLSDFESERDELLKECGNWLHDSVPESNNEVYSILIKSALSIICWCVTLLMNNIVLYFYHNRRPIIELNEPLEILINVKSTHTLISYT